VLARCRCATYRSRMDDAAALYSIGAIARMTGVSVSTLRTWEDRYGLIVATRSEGGQRRYSRHQLEQLMFISAEIGRGSTPGDAHRLLADRGSAAPPETESAPSIGLLILVAERDPFTASYMDYFLRTEGYRVELVADAEQAEARLGVLGPRLAIVELMLSGGLGGSLITKLKEARTLVIAVSPLAAEEVSEALGADAFLQKPIDPVVLLSTVRDLLGTSVLTAVRVPSAS
jgi:DNA-binding transcriptional MerR regulator